MVSLFDALKSSKGLPANDPIAGIWGRKLAGGKNQETEGTLPLTISANGENLIDYHIYGAVGGVGDDSGTAYGYVVPMRVKGNVHIDPNDGIYGYTINAYNSSITANNNWWISNYIPIIEGATYTGVNTGQDVLIYDEIDGKATGVTGLRSGYTIPQGKHYMRMNVNISVINNFTVSVIYPSPIYIGSTPLEQGEYVDYGEQKVYKYVDGVLTPTDPPVALPALPTIDGTTVYDADLVTKPSKMYVKYRKY